MTTNSVGIDRNVHLITRFVLASGDEITIAEKLSESMDFSVISELLIFRKLSEPADGRLRGNSPLLCSGL